MTRPQPPRDREPQRSLSEQAITVGMELLGKVDPKYLKSAGGFLLKTQMGRGGSAPTRRTGSGSGSGAGSAGLGGRDFSGVAKQLGALLAEMGALRSQPGAAQATAPSRPRIDQPAPGAPSVPAPAPLGTFTGEPAIPGRAVGPARVVTGTDLPTGLTAGDVLVCRSVPPAWTPALGNVAGIVFETGGAGSVALRSCRAQGIPAVRLDKATQRIDDGAAISLDGASGRVRLT